MKKILLSTLTALFTLAVILTSCGENTPQNPSDSTSAQTEEAVTEAVTGIEALYAKLPTEDFDGYEMRMAQFLFGHLEDMTKYQVTVNEITGEAVNDELYSMSRKVENKLNVSVATDVYNEAKELNTAMSNSIASGDDIWDAYFNIDAASFISTGGMQRLNGISAFDFTNPWWTGSAMASAQLTMDTYLAYGSLSMQEFSNYWVTIFNKSVAENYNIGDLYQLVRDGKWTIDKAAELSKTVSTDVNGDGKYDPKEDIFGLSTTTVGLFSYLIAGDANLIKYDDNGEAYYDGADERFFDVFKSIADIVSDKQLYYEAWTVNNYSQYHIMSENNVLFANLLIIELENLRDMPSDFGALPNPKYNEAQESYISNIYTDYTPLAIPITVSDTERAAVILENLCAETYMNVKDIYIEQLLMQKLIRDEDSVEMLNLIFDSKSIIEKIYVYGWTEMRGVFENEFKSNAESLASNMEALKNQLTEEVGNSVEMYKSSAN